MKQKILQDIGQEILTKLEELEKRIDQLLESKRGDNDGNQTK